MAITFKRFSGNERMSEETMCYATDVLFEGKPIGSCRNDGRGGEGFFQQASGVDEKLLERAADWVRQQVYREEDGSAATFDGKIMTMERIGEYCDYLACEVMNEKRVVSQVKRKLRTSVLFVDPARNNDIFAIKGPYKGQPMKQAIEQRYPGAVVLNDLPIDQAVAAFKAVSLREAEAAKANAATPARRKSSP